MLRLKLTIILLFLMGYSWGQETPVHLISTAGNQLKTNALSISWSIGEITTETLSASDLELTQGFHQGKYLITAVEEIVPNQPQIKIYPNPATDFFYIKLPSEIIMQKSVNAKIITMQGQTILSKTLTNNEQKIDIQGFANSIYILHITFDGESRRIFKIVKQ